MKAIYKSDNRHANSLFIVPPDQKKRARGPGRPWRNSRPKQQLLTRNKFHSAQRAKAFDSPLYFAHESWQRERQTERGALAAARDRERDRDRRGWRGGAGRGVEAADSPTSLHTPRPPSLCKSQVGQITHARGNSNEFCEQLQ